MIHNRTDFSLRDSLSAMTNAVLGNTYDLPGSAFDAFERSHSEQIIHRHGSHSVSPTERFPKATCSTPKASMPPVVRVRVGASGPEAVLGGAGRPVDVFASHQENAVREPHWHPVTPTWGTSPPGAPGCASSTPT